MVFRVNVLNDVALFVIEFCVKFFCTILLLSFRKNAFFVVSIKLRFKI